MKALRVLLWRVYAALGHGKVLPKHQHDAFTKNEQLLFDNTERIAATLEAAGIPCERKGCLPLSLVNTITGEVIPVRMWRPIGILPAVTVVKRRGDALELEAFCSTLNPKRLRMRLITSGPRCFVDQVGERISFLLNGCRLVQARQWFSSVAELVSLGIEFPVVRGKTKKPVRSHGQLQYHVHGHPIIYMKRWLSDKEWADFGAKWHEHFKTVCPDSGVIRDIREAAKYPMKAVDLEVVRQHGELVALFHQLHRRHLFQPYGSFRIFRKDLTDTGRKVKRLYRPDGTYELVLVEKQPSTRVKYNRDRPSRSVPQDIFLGRRLPRASVANPTMAVCELWMNLTSTPEKARLKRNLKVWTADEPQPTPTAPAGAKDPGQVHTVTLNDCLPDADQPAPKDQVVYHLRPGQRPKKK